MGLFTPMRAADLKGDMDLALYPTIASPKLDGYRATVQDAGSGPVVLSKNNKAIPNRWVQECLSRSEFLGLDGELVVGSPTAPGSLQATSSGVTSVHGAPDFTFWVFDYVPTVQDLDRQFQHRLQALQGRYGAGGILHVKVVPQKLIKTPNELIAFEAKCVAQGYEGVMVRAPGGRYKQGGAEPRSTVSEQLVAKLKRVEHHEARVLSVYEQMHNANEATKDEIGRTKRSTAKAGKVGKGVLGGCVVQGISGRWDGVQYDVGTGFTDGQRAKLWATGDMIGRIMKVETGVTPATFKKPQFPRFVDWKWEGDL